MVDRGALEKRFAAMQRGFESHPLRLKDRQTAVFLFPRYSACQGLLQGFDEPIHISMKVRIVADLGSITIRECFQTGG